MFSSLDLPLRERGKLAGCWLAATLSDRQFRKIVNAQTIRSIDLHTTCAEILKFVSTDNTNQRSRFILYVSAQLVYGAAKLLKIQVTLFQDSLFKIQTDLIPNDLTSRDKKKTSEVPMIDEMLVDMTLLDLTPATLEDADLRDDRHLLPEINLKEIEDFKMRTYVEELDFGPITEEELGLLLNGDDFRMCLSPNRGYADGYDKAAEQLRAAETTAEAQNLDFSVHLAVAEESAAIDPAAQLLRTPQKRASIVEDLDTSSKRLRLELEQESNAALVDNFADREVDVVMRPIDESVGLPQEDPALPAESVGLPQEDPALPVEEAPALPAQESMEQELPTAAPGRRRRIGTIDLTPRLSESGTGKSKYSKLDVYTTQSFPPVPVRKRGMLAAALLVHPTTNGPFYRAADSSKWAGDLTWDNELRIIGPFLAGNDTSMGTSLIRLAEPLTDLRPAELSMRLGDATGLESSPQNKTAEPIPMDHDGIVEPMRTELPEVPEVPEAPIAPEIPEAPIATEVPEDGPPANITNSEDVDAFLPPKLRRKRSNQEKCSFEKSPNPDKAVIIDVPEIPVFMRPEESVEQSFWTKPELLACLEVLWADRPVVILADLLPPATTRRVDATECFILLLELFEDELVDLKQYEPYGDIYVTKVSADSNGMDCDEA